MSVILPWFPRNDSCERPTSIIRSNIKISMFLFNNIVHHSKLPLIKHVKSDLLFFPMLFATFRSHSRKYYSFSMRKCIIDSSSFVFSSSIITEALLGPVKHISDVNYLKSKFRTCCPPQFFLIKGASFSPLTIDFVKPFEKHSTLWKKIGTQKSLL